MFTIPEKKIIAVMGATGLQGSAVVDALLTATDEFSVRAITCNPESVKAKALVKRGCEVVKADAEDVASMVTAFSGAYGAFLVTNFWANMSMTNEIKTTDKLHEAVDEAKVEHVVLLNLEDTRTIINASEKKDTWNILNEETKSYVPHFDGKGEAGQRFLDSDVPVTLLFTTFYYDNFINFGMGPKKYGEYQPLSMKFPTGHKPFALNYLNEIGCSVLKILQDLSTINTKQGVVSIYASGKDLADAFSKVLVEPVVFNAVPVNVYASFDFPGAADLASMFRFYTSFKDPIQKVEACEERIGRKTDSLESWIEENKAAFAHVETSA